MGLTIACRKVRYRTRSEAAFVAGKIVESGMDTRPDVVLRPYLCTPCEAWHVGHDMVPDDESSHMNH